MKRKPPQTTFDSAVARMGAQGRLVLPAQVREDVGIKEGDRLVVIVENGEIHLLTPLQSVRRVQAMARKYIKPGRDLVRELLEERRREAELE